MMGEMILRNLVHRPIRTFIGIIAIAVEVALVVLIVGLTSGILSETAKRVEGVGADIMLQPSSAGVIIGMSNSPMPVKIKNRLEQLQYIQSVAPVLLQFNSSGGVELVYGIDKSFDEVSGGFVFLQGRNLQEPDDMLLDDLAVQSKHVQVGQKLRLFNHDWNVVGIVEHGKGSRIFVPLSTLQELSGATDKASLFFIKCTRPEHTDDVIAQMKTVFPNYTIRAIREYVSLMTSTSVPGLNAFVDAMIGLAVCIGLLVIFLTMYTTVIERTRDIGVLKSLGANSPFIVRAVLYESAMLCAGGILAGIGLSYALRAGFLRAYPTLSILITPEWILRAAAIALFGAVLGASYPAWVASRKDAVEALTFD
ncbi:MAG: ABC transporter permease [Acidobacteria bacterium]|nr:ABC transporter permease [Acidobacteriota bacterium]MBS1866716.1 ABC transporter permease [Acidobacteriota bacterium]